MTSADFCPFSVGSLQRLPSALGFPDRPPRVRVQSFLPSICFIYSVSPSAERASFCRANSPNDTQPPMKFVFLRPEVCRPLPSDSASPQTPLR